MSWTKITLLIDLAKIVKGEHKYLFRAIPSWNKHLLSSYCMLIIEEHDLTPIKTSILKEGL